MAGTSRSQPSSPRGRSAARGSTAPKGRTWRQARPAPVVVISGGESLLADRAVERIVQLARSKEPEVEVSVLDAALYEPGTLGSLATPSLFSEPRLIVVRNLAEGVEAAQVDVAAYLENVDEAVTCVLVHSGVAKAKKLVDTAVAAGAELVTVPSPKRDDERLAFVASEFDDAKRRITTAAAQALVDAFGSDLRELASACSQLISDIEGDVDEEAVRRYYGGRAEATGFEVADAIAARDQEAALLAVRRAVDSGVDPIPLVAAIASRLRGMAKVAAVRGSAGQIASELGMAPWLVDKARRELRVWSPAELGRSLVILAEVDLALKGGLEVAGQVEGGSFDHVFTLERAVLAMTTRTEPDD